MLGLRRVSGAVIAAGLTAGFLIGALAGAASAEPPSPLQRAFADAASASHVPAELLLAISYQLTRWDDHGTAPSASGGYGLMHLTDVTADSVEDARGLGELPNADAIAGDESLHRLDAAAKLAGAGAEQVKADRALNLRAGAALLAERARELNFGALPADLAGWYPAVGWYSGSPQASGANAFADDVYESLREGVTRTVNSGEVVTLAPTDVQAVGAAPPATAHGLTPNDPGVDCPADLHCRWIPAAYAWNNPADPNSYGNYDPANRPADGNQVKYIVIHDTESSYASTISSAQNSKTYVASHYVIRSSDGEVTQMIRTKDIGWHAGNWHTNVQSIGIEHEAFARDGATWYTEAMYRSSAKLVRYLAAKYRIPLDRTHIIGHEDVEGSRPALVAGAHWDPGPFWDWEHYLALLGTPIHGGSGRVRTGDVVTITPGFADNQQGGFPICWPPPCTNVPVQPSNFLYLRTEPRAGAPLIGDPVLQPGGQPGKPNGEDWGNKAVAGRQYVVAGAAKDWLAIWYGTTKGWIYDPEHQRVRASCGAAKVTPRAGLASIPVYGRPLPEPAEYPAGTAPGTISPLQYTIPAGQQYVVGATSPTFDYYARFDGANVPLNHTVVVGKQTFVHVSLNHRWGWLKLADVTFVR